MRALDMHTTRRGAGRRRLMAALASAMVGTLALTGAACRDISTQPLPAGTFDPTTVNTRAGARAFAITAQAQFQFALSEYIPVAGLLTDELQANTRGTALANNAFPDRYVAMDARYLPQGSVKSFLGLASDKLYATLQQTRAFTNQAIGALFKYDRDSSVARRGDLYVQQGYAELMLADLYCSGVPLSTSDFQADFTYKPGSTTTQVYEHAATLFDSALALVGDSVDSIANVARIGKARALIAIQQYAAAAQLVSAIPVEYVYSQPLKTCGVSGAACISGGVTQASFGLASIGSESDLEGGTGLPFRSSADPRSMPLPGTIGTVNGNPVYFPAKFTLDGLSNLVVASGIEAQLISAEAELDAGNANWLARLNALRTTCTDAATCATPAPAGMGGVAGLPPLTDPGTDTARVSLLFRERAFWLFLTGTRQGDLRRLIHNYGRFKDDIYPRGAYPAIGTYGTNVDAPIPIAGNYSETPNPYFTGCLSRD
jgi:hypothetical protein